MAIQFREMTVPELRAEEATLLHNARTGCLPNSRVRAPIDPRVIRTRLVDVRAAIGRRLSGDA